MYLKNLKQDHSTNSTNLNQAEVTVESKSYRGSFEQSLLFDMKQKKSSCGRTKINANFVTLMNTSDSNSSSSNKI